MLGALFVSYLNTLFQLHRLSKSERDENTSGLEEGGEVVVTISIKTLAWKD
jgi:hypothetical protein